MKKILFFAEGATLAHVARPFVLASGLDPAQYAVSFACPEPYQWIAANAPFRKLPLRCQAASVFAQRLERGLPLYDFATLRAYVEDDLALIDQERPDVVVGDFRLSLSVSARLRKVRYLTICDAYWSPERAFRPPLPALTFTRFTPIPIAERIFRWVSPLAFRLHARPMERLRAHYGLPSFGHDLRLCYTDADMRLFANFPELFPDVATGPQATFLGPLSWSPGQADDNPPAVFPPAPMVYVTMGSSGDPAVLRTLIPLLEATGANIVVATAGKPVPAGLGSEHTRLFPYVDGNEACRHARLVVCNGGSPTTNQALACGVPVLGIASNMDQFMNMQAIERFGAGLHVRSDRVSDNCFKLALNALLDNPRFADRARALIKPEELNTKASATLVGHAICSNT